MFISALEALVMAFHISVSDTVAGGRSIAAWSLQIAAVY
jgi:hypothetical protein